MCRKFKAAKFITMGVYVFHMYYMFKTVSLGKQWTELVFVYIIQNLQMVLCLLIMALTEVQGS